LEPFKNWVKPSLEAGDTVYSYVAIRSDEEHREGMVAQHENLKVVMPFRENGLDKASVLEILDASGLGLPKYYDWRSRSGCTFASSSRRLNGCASSRPTQRRLKTRRLTRRTHWSTAPVHLEPRRALTDLEKPERVAQIITDFELRKQRELARRRPNPLRVIPIEPVDIDDLYLEDEGGGACLVCHK
jgi:hypothetical protein